MEHFCTLFNHAFLPQGLALHESMVRHCGEFQLYVLCIDPLVESQLRELDLPRVTLLPLAEFETDRLLAVKSGRTLAEYCWTLTPHIFEFVNRRFLDLRRLTYLDADLFFFDSPTPFFDEFEASGKDVLITEHAYAPEYDRSATSGRFCVQYLTVNFSERGRRVVAWWRDRCIEWCFDRVEEGRFGDQKYLDQWPELFAESVHVLAQTEKTIAPWNIDHFGEGDRILSPVFYHFHGFRIPHPKWARGFCDYSIRRKNQWVYAEYGKSVRRSLRIVRGAGIPVPCLPVDHPKLAALRYLKRVFLDHTTRWIYLG